MALAATANPGQNAPWLGVAGAMAPPVAFTAQRITAGTTTRAVPGRMRIVLRSRQINAASLGPFHHSIRAREPPCSAGMIAPWRPHGAKAGMGRAGRRTPRRREGLEWSHDAEAAALEAGEARDCSSSPRNSLLRYSN